MSDYRHKTIDAMLLVYSEFKMSQIERVLSISKSVASRVVSNYTEQFGNVTHDRSRKINVQSDDFSSAYFDSVFDAIEYLNALEVVMGQPVVKYETRVV